MTPTEAQKKGNVNVTYLNSYFSKNAIRYKNHILKLVIEFIYVNLGENFLIKVTLQTGLKKYL